VPKTAEILGGPVLFEGRDLLRMTERERRALRWREMAFIPQTAMSALDPVYRVGRQIEEVLVERAGRSRAAARARAEELFGLVGIDAARLDDYPHQFSGGMKQRASIAIALALEPKLVLADEPVTALDVIVQRQVLDLLKGLQARLNLSVVLVTHDISVVAYACDRVVVMYAGRVVESGPVAEVLERPLHPYTMGLTNAFPDLERAGGELVPIEGSPPSLLDPPKGCRFAPRCPFAQPRCTQTEPPLTTDAAGHASACWRAEEAPALRPLAREAATWRV
jgi:peptide/nickel transport system ATP-binding protein